jgi:hypothetical protein
MSKKMRMQRRFLGSSIVVPVAVLGNKNRQMQFILSGAS